MKLPRVLHVFGRIFFSPFRIVFQATKDCFPFDDAVLGCSKCDKANKLPFDEFVAGLPISFHRFTPGESPHLKGLR